MTEIFEEPEALPNVLLRPTSTQQVSDYMRRKIFDGTLKVGERVPQDEIAAELGVSRVPVREAVIALDREGWVMIQPHRGAFVVGLDKNSTRDHYELLGRVYGCAALRAAERGSDEQMAALTAVHRQLQAAADPHEFSKLNIEFLRRMVSMSASRRVSATVRLMAVDIVPGDFFAGIPEAIRVRKRHLRVIMKAMNARDGESAEREIIVMLRQEAGLVIALLTERGVIGQDAIGGTDAGPSALPRRLRVRFDKHAECLGENLALLGELPRSIVVIGQRIQHHVTQRQAAQRVEQRGPDRGTPDTGTRQDLAQQALQLHACRFGDAGHGRPCLPGRPLVMREVDQHLGVRQVLRAAVIPRENVGVLRDPLGHRTPSDLSRHQGLVQAPSAVLKGRQHQRLTAAEVVLDHSPADPGPLGDGIRAGPVEALIENARSRGFDETLA
jgi:DNA-binding GntR family transcriptional regulator